MEEYKSDRTAGDSITTPGVARRSYLRMVGASAFGAVAASGLTRAARNVVDLGDEGLSDGDTIDPYLADYWESGNEVHVPAGTYNWNGDHLGGTINDAALIGDGDVYFDIGDGGDVYNTLTVSSGSTEVRNITVTGTAASGKNRIAWQCTDSNASLTVENFDLPGGSYGFGEHPSPIGMFVRDDNVGTVTIRDCYIEGFANNGIYSTHSPGATIVECCHVVDCDIDGIRLGDNDEIHDSLVEMRQMDDALTGRGVRVRYDGNVVIDGLHVVNDEGSVPLVSAPDTDAHCDVSNVYIENNTGNNAIEDNSGSFDVGGNVNVTGSGSYDTPGVDGSNVATGSDATPPETSMSNVCSDSDDGDTHFEITTVDGGPELLYEFTVEGSSVTRDESNGDNSAETNNDSITDNGDGTFTVSGETGNGYGDSYYYDGEVTSWSANVDDSNYTLYRDGEEVTPAELNRAHLEITTVDGGPELLYEFTVDGASVSRDESNGDDSAETNNDSITDNGDGTFTVSGETGNGYGDSYYYDGEVTSWSANVDASNYTLNRDGTEVSRFELAGSHFEITTVDGGPELLYEFTVEGSDADVTRDESNGDNSAETNNDSVTDNGDGTFTVSGETGNGYGDSYHYLGSLANWSANIDDSNYTLYRDGDEIQPGDIS